MSAVVQVVDYDSRWPELFTREAGRILAILGPAALRVEHCGSTSVPGLAAKPVIDIVMEVPDSSDEKAYVSALEPAGYKVRIREPAWYEHRMLKGPNSDINLHVFSSGCPEIDRMLLFRNWLRGHPADLELYAHTKRALATQSWESVQQYADAKTVVVEQILARAGARLQ